MGLTEAASTAAAEICSYFETGGSLPRAAFCCANTPLPPHRGMPPARLLALPIRRYPLAHPFGPLDCWDGLQTRGLAHIFKRCPESMDIKCGISKQGDGISIAQNGRLRTAAVCHRHRRLRRPYCPQGNRTARRSASEPQKLSKSASVPRQRRMRSEKTKKAPFRFRNSALQGWKDSNPRPTALEAVALPTELRPYSRGSHRLNVCIYAILEFVWQLIF